MDILRTAGKSSLTTPPESLIHLPLTSLKSYEKSVPPSSVQHVLGEIRSRRDGRHTTEEPWLSFLLDVDEYRELQRLMVADDDFHDFVENKLRYSGHISFTGPLIIS
jgi:hypothetical protein